MRINIRRRWLASEWLFFSAARDRVDSADRQAWTTREEPFPAQLCQSRWSFKESCFALRPIDDGNGLAGEMREEFQLPARRDAALPKGADDTTGRALLNGDFRNLRRVNRIMVVTFTFETVYAGIATICGSR
jgi:hypothetical protein